MKSPLVVTRLLIAAIAPMVLPVDRATGADDLQGALEQATKAAVAKVSPSLVQIQTVGGLEILGSGRASVIRGKGPTTGVIVSPDGYVISSSFNFAHKPSAITAALPTGRVVAAKVVAHDHTRMLTLLKIDAAGLAVPTTALKKDLRIGQWVVALGKAWSAGGEGPPSVSVGIISALGRIWGKAVQTDAKVSPVNYGGPLIDLQGRVIGILSPLSPRAEGETAGLEWYDSGIGFAVPLEDVNRILPQLKLGKDLKKGLLGVAMQGQDQVGGKAVVGTVLPDSTAAKAGIAIGDEIVEIDSVKVVRHAQLLHVLGSKYEGDKVNLKVKRGDKVIDLPNLQLFGEPASHVHAFLGILPMRDDGEPGVEIRHIFAKGAAEAAGLKVGDRILKLETAPVINRNALLGMLNGLSPGAVVKLEVKRKDGDKTETVSATLGQFPEAIPAELPLATKKKALASPKPMPGQPPMGRPGRKPAPEKQAEPKKEEPKEKKPAKTGHYTKTDPTTGRQAWAFVPDDYDPNISYTLVVWLHPAGEPFEANILQIWKDFCKQHHMILLGPKAENRTGWLTSEVDLIKEDIREMLETYTIDRHRIVLHGHGDGGSLACYLAFDARDLVRGVANVGGVLQSSAKENLGPQRLAFFMIAGGKDPVLEGIKATKAKLTEKKFPIVYRELPEQGNGYVTDANLLREMVRWIDSLDRL